MPSRDREGRADPGRGGGSRAKARARAGRKVPPGSHAPTRQDRGEPARHVWRPALGAAVCSVALYVSSLRYGFVRDDHWLIEANSPLHSAGSFTRFLTADFWASVGRASGLWRPLILASYWLDDRLAHGRPIAFHAMSVLAHAATSALLALVMTAAGLGAAGVWIGALWFAAMPAHV